jgi:hypothetical protein
MLLERESPGRAGRVRSEETLRGDFFLGERLNH